mmetsp:Transcript_34564/g.32940  ORF Transcript_34564/g.32940 Transcript_34564/m.32940 type:complete len:162 (-) Transcript_34564:433-918(-)
MCLSGRQVESEGGIWFKIGDTIKFIHNKTIKYGLITRVTASEVCISRLIQSTRKDRNSPMSKLYGLNIMVYHPELVLTVKIKEIISAIFVGREYLFESGDLPYHKKIENIYGITHMSLINKKELVLLEEDLFTDGIAKNTFPLIENSTGYKDLQPQLYFLE